MNYYEILTLINIACQQVLPPKNLNIEVHTKKLEAMSISKSHCDFEKKFDFL